MVHSILGNMDGLNYTVVTYRFKTGDAVVDTKGVHGVVANYEQIGGENFYTVRLDGGEVATMMVNEKYLLKKHLDLVCECGAEAVFGKDTVLHSATLPCPKYRGSL